MNKLWHDLLLRIVKLLNAVLITIPFALCWYLYYASRIASPYYSKGNWLVIGLFFMFYIILGRIHDAFLISMNRISEVIYSQCLSFLMADGIMYIIAWLLSKHLPNLVPGLIAFAGQAVFSVVWALLAHQWYFVTFPPKVTAIVYDQRRDMHPLINEYGLGKKYSVQQIASVEEYLNNLDTLIGIETVFLGGVHSHDRNIILKYCIANGIEVFVIPRIGDVIMSGARQMHMFHLPMLRVRRYNAPPEYLFIKRALDIVLSAVALLMLSPVMLIVAIGIKATDGGTVFYRQTRLTKDGKRFQILKFRSMRVDAEKDGIARLAKEKDDRITPIGKVMRAVRLDELPQLINIFKGEMSLVGPRPERPEIAERYEKDMPEFVLRLQMKAGLTGYAQVYGKYNTTPYDKLQMDLMYIAKPSIIKDFQLILATIKILFIPESTQGIKEEHITAVAEK